MKEIIEVEVKDFDTHMGDRKRYITASVSETVLSQTYMPRILEAFALKVSDVLTTKWIEEHGQEVMEQVALGAIADAMRTQISKKLLEQFK